MRTWSSSIIRQIRSGWRCPINRPNSLAQTQGWRSIITPRSGRLCRINSKGIWLSSIKASVDSGEQADAFDVVTVSRQGVAFDPAAHHVFADLLHAQELSQHVFRAEQCVAEIRYALCVSRNRKPHYTRLFHVICPIIIQRANSILAINASYLVPVIGVRMILTSNICRFLRRFPNDKRACCRYLGI